MNGVTIVPLYYRAGEVLWQAWDAISGVTLFTGTKEECQHFATTHKEC